jgi:hypothetical protein
MMGLEEAVEALAQMVWVTEYRAGVRHFVTGQHRVLAIKDPDEPDVVAVAAFAPVAGHSVVVLPIVRLDGKLGHAGMCAHILCGMPRAETLPDDFELSEAMLAALDRAGIT